MVLASKNIMQQFKDFYGGMQPGKLLQVAFENVTSAVLYLHVPNYILLKKSWNTVLKPEIS